MMKFQKVVLSILIDYYDLQILKVSCDFKILDVNVVETPWKYSRMFMKMYIGMDMIRTSKGMLQ
jgi:hypothetical protein